MILSDLKDVIEKDKLPREEAILKILSDFAKENGLNMTAVISYEEEESHSMPVIAVIRQDTPLGIVKIHGEIHSETIQRIIHQRRKSHEDL
jgi:hypothetical protein